MVGLEAVDDDTEAVNEVTEAPVWDKKSGGPDKFLESTLFSNLLLGFFRKIIGYRTRSGLFWASTQVLIHNHGLQSGLI